MAAVPSASADGSATRSRTRIDRHHVHVPQRAAAVEALLEEPATSTRRPARSSGEGTALRVTWRPRPKSEWTIQHDSWSTPPRRQVSWRMSPAAIRSRRAAHPRPLPPFRPPRPCRRVPRIVAPSRSRIARSPVRAANLACSMALKLWPRGCPCATGAVALNHQAYRMEPALGAEPTLWEDRSPQRGDRALLPKGVATPSDRPEFSSMADDYARHALSQRAVFEGAVSRPCWPLRGGFRRSLCCA